MIEDVVRTEKDYKEFMSWLWNKDRKTYTFICMGHFELITEELINEYEESRNEEHNDI